MIFLLSAVYVVVLRKQIHSAEELMNIYERTDKYQTAQYSPEPIAACTERVADAAAAQFVTDTGRHLVIPYQRNDSECEP